MIKHGKLLDVELPSPWAKSPMFSMLSPDWATPAHIYEALDSEFHFDLDPCPLGGLRGGLAMDWTGRRVYCNPPYGPAVGAWLSKHKEAAVAVYLLPARTDVHWFHRYIGDVAELRFIRGRLKFGDGKSNAPFPSMILIFKGKSEPIGGSRL